MLQIRLVTVVQQFEWSLIERALREQQGNQCRAALALGIHRNTLARKINQMPWERISALRINMHRDRKRVA